MELFGFPIWMVLLVWIGVFCASFVDSIGGGGGIISLPTYLLAGLPMHVALGTNKLSSCIGTVASTARFIKNGYVNWLLAIPSIALAITGAHFGTKLQLSVDEQYLKYVLIFVLPIIAIILFKKKDLPEEQKTINKWLCRFIVWSTALVCGVYDGFYGPGTGTFLLLSFCYLAKLDVRTASGNVKVVNLSSNVSALFTSLLAGKVLVPLGLSAAVFAIAGQYIGAGLTLKNGTKIVRPFILVVIVLLMGKVLLEVLGII